MKKIYLAAAGAVLAMSANAQYTLEEPYADKTLHEGTVQIYDIFLAGEDVFTGLEKAGQKINDIRPNGEAINLWVWDGTFVGGDGSYPGVGFNDFQFDGYTSLNVSNVGWSGAGFDVQGGFSSEHWTDATRFHLAVRTTNTAPVSTAFIIADDGTPAKVALGDAFNDNGAVFPAIGPRINDEWMGIDISFADLKKAYPQFAYNKLADWKGNILSILGGGVEGQNISMDCGFFYTPTDDNAVKGVDADAKFVVSRNTVNALNASSIELYDLSGRLVKSVNSNTLGISDLGSGIYVAKAGNAVKKILK